MHRTRYVCLLMYVAVANLILEGRTTGGERLPLSRAKYCTRRRLQRYFNLRMQTQSLYKTLTLFVFANE